MKKWFIYSLILFLSACGSEDLTQRPPGLLADEKFVEVLAEVQLLEATYKQKIIREDDPTAVMPTYYQQVFDKYETSQEEFEKTYEWWMKDPKAMLEIYNKVIDQLAKMEKQHSLGEDQ